jgi:arylsulfatase A-like enzyme
MPDQMRADCMSAAGHPQIRTPCMDRLANEGVRFTRAHTVSPLCMPARASFVSGLYPHNHGMWDNRGQLPANDETFFHHLQRAGYYTGHIGKSHYHPHGGKHLRESEDYMRARGLDYVHETTGPWATLTTDSYLTDYWQTLGLVEVFREDYRERQRSGGLVVRPSPLPVEAFPDSYVGRRAVEFIDSYQRAEPIALFVGFGGPHEPWDAPGEYATMYDPSETPPPIAPEEAGQGLPDRVREQARRGLQPDMGAAEVAAIRANYGGKISLVDRWVGEITAALERRRWLDDAAIVLWSDHGEMAGDHGRLHKSVFYNSAVNVPLFARWPGRIPPGRTCDALVENIDVFPTLLEALGLEPSRRCLGRSLWPLLEDSHRAHRDAVFSEVATQGVYGTMIRTPRYKYATDHTGAGYQLFDLDADPDERRNLAGHPDFAAVEDELRDRLLRFHLEAQVRR